MLHLVPWSIWHLVTNLVSRPRHVCPDVGNVAELRQALLASIAEDGDVEDAAEALAAAKPPRAAGSSELLKVRRAAPNYP